MKVEEYNAEFDNLMIKVKLVQFEKHTIARYLGGLKYEISYVIVLHSYCSLIDVYEVSFEGGKTEKMSSANRFK